MTVKSCHGCRYLVLFSNNVQPRCRVTDGGPPVSVDYDPYTNTTTKYYGFRPTTVEMRNDGAACGPDAVLFQPTLYHRITTWMGEKDVVWS